MKDQGTGQILLQGHLCNGVYKFSLKSSSPSFLKFESNTSPIALSIVLHNYHVNDIDIWHKRLSHPHSNVIRNALKNVYNANISMNKMNLCEACALENIMLFPFLLQILNIYILYNSLYVIFGTLLLTYLKMAAYIILVLLMHIVDILGFIFFNLSLMHL